MKTINLQSGLGKPVSRLFRVLASCIAIVGTLSLVLAGVLYYFGARTFQLNISTLLDLSLSTFFCLFFGYIAMYGKTPAFRR